MITTQKMYDVLLQNLTLFFLGFNAEILDRFLRMFGFRSIYADQPDPFPIDEKKGVSIDYTCYLIYLGMGSGEKKEKD